MLAFTISVLGILLTIFLVVSIHEFGHFIFARFLGVKVLRFSIGFGKPFYQWRDRKGTEYAFAPILLGGYVKLLDENENPVPENELPMAYNRQPIYKRFLIAFAGPLFNLLFAFILYWLLFIIGITTFVPQVGTITPHSIASDAGMQPRQEIISIDHTSTPTWMSVIINILTQAGNKGIMPIEVKQPDTHEIKLLNLNLTNWHLDDLKPDPFTSLGFVPYDPLIPAIIKDIQPDSDAFTKLTKGDKILSVGKQPIHDWSDLVTIITAHPGETLAFTINHHGKIVHTQITTGYQRDMFLKKYGFLGVTPEFTWPESLFRKQQYGPLDSVIHAYRQVSELTQLIRMLIMLISCEGLRIIIKTWACLSDSSRLIWQHAI